jgi:peptidoglycan/LPS O-acetylase OafA/YrhL
MPSAGGGGKVSVASIAGELGSDVEAGTAPEDRRFRPDVEGLRAVAVLLVILYHANVPHVTGGYVGVDVFFVVSGFVITGVLLRERGNTGRT